MLGHGGPGVYPRTHLLPGQRLMCPLAAELEYEDLEPGKSSTTAGFEGLEAARPEIAEARARAG